MPIYEYFCRRCNERFELLRPMSRADEEATCPEGHGRGERTLSLVADYRRTSTATSEPAGGGCACGAGGCGSCG